jgi:hypothetical protein
MKKTRKIDRLYAKKEKIDLDIEKLREKCEHKNTSKSTISFRPGSYNPGITCDDCDQIMDNEQSMVINGVTITSDGNWSFDGNLPGINTSIAIGVNARGTGTNAICIGKDVRPSPYAPETLYE